MGKRPGPGKIGRLAAIAAIVLTSGCGGGPAKLEFHEDAAGNFRVLAAGTPAPSKRTVSTPSGPLQMTTVESVDGHRIRRLVAYVDLPASMVQSTGAVAMLDGGVRKLAEGGKWTVKSQEPIEIDGHPGRDVRFEVSAEKLPEKGTGRARVFLVGDRLYQTIMVGPASKVVDEELDHFIKSFELLKKVPAVAVAVTTVAAPDPTPAAPPATMRPAPATVATNPAPGPPPGRFGRPVSSRFAPGRAMPPRRRTPRARSRDEERVVQEGNDGPDPSQLAAVAIEAATGGFLSTIPAPDGNPRDQYREVAPSGGVLVGIRAGYVEIFNGPKIATIQPIFQVGSRYVDGPQIGKPVTLETTVVARPGYAIGAVRTRTGLTVDAFQVVFMRFHDGRLDPADSYSTNWLGDPRGGGPRDASGEGKLIVGIHGRSDGRAINKLGLLAVE